MLCQSFKALHFTFVIPRNFAAKKYRHFCFYLRNMFVRLYHFDQEIYVSLEFYIY